jgi:CO/xanthine dehydrogenase FAD-binding subunit
VHAFDYVAAQSVEQAVALLSRPEPRAQVLCGGTDLIVQLREGRRQPDLLVDIKAIPDLNQLAYDSRTGWLIGAAVPCARVAAHPAARNYPALADAAALIGGVQVQNRATLGGNLCNASPAADSIPALIVHSAVCLVHGPEGQREIPVKDFCTAPGQTCLQPGELLVAVRLPPVAPRSGAAYLRFTPRAEMDIAVAGAAALVLLADAATIESAQIAVGAVAPTPLLVPEAGQALRGQAISGAVLERAAEAARQAARPITDLRGTLPQRRHLSGVLVRRALERAIERATQRLGKE